MKTSRLALALVPFLVTAIADIGCSGSDGAPGSGGTGGDGAGNTSGAGASTGTGAVSGGGGDAPCVQVGTVTGQVLDQDGNPPSKPTITICGNACMKGELAADGTFSMQVDFCYGASTFYEVPVFIYHGWKDYADVTANFVPDGANEVPQGSVGVITTMTTAGMAFFPYPEATATSFADGNGLSIIVAADTVEIPAFEAEVAVGAVALDDFPLGDPPPELSALYFVGPDNTVLSQPAIVRFPNTAQLAPGSSVELLALGNMGTTGVIKAGTFDVVGTGRVTGDGMYVVSDPAQDSGLITFGWIGYRPSN